MVVIALASRIRAVSTRLQSRCAAMTGNCQVSLLGRQATRSRRAPSQSAICSALETVADRPTIRGPESPPRMRASSASRTGPRAVSPSRWISSTIKHPTSANASRSEDARHMASNFSVVATHRSASRTLPTSTLCSPESRSTRSPSRRHASSSRSSSSVSDRCGTSQAAFRPCSSTVRSAAAIPGVKVLSDVHGVEATRFGAETSGHTLLFDRDGRLFLAQQL